MKPQLKSTPAARELIKRFEPFQPAAIRGEDGRWVIGYGHHAAAKEGARISEQEADLLLIYDVLQAETALDEVVNAPLKPSQRDALVSFVTDIGARAFHTSDVARYLFEGRSMAAGEALAIYGDAGLDRREAESALFMTAFAPPTSKKAEEREKSTVELVIKVEHPAENSVLEPAGGVPEAAPAQAEVPAAPASPPPSAAEQASRREAEDEIARILAVVGEIPMGDMASSERPVAAEAPLPATEPAEVEATHEAPIVETVAEDEADEAPIEAIIEVEPSEDSVAEARMSDPVQSAPVRRKRSVFSGPLDALSGTAPSPNSSPSVPLDSVLPAEAEPVETTPELTSGDEDADESHSPAASTDSDAAAAQVIARMSREIADVPTDAQPSEPGRASVNTYDESLPPNATLGFVLVGSMAAHFANDAEPEASVEAELAELADAMRDDEADINDDVETEPASDPAGQVAAEEAEDTPVAEPEGAPDLVAQVLDVVEKEVERAGQSEDTPPPHPAYEPAAADGAVGEIEAPERDDDQDRSIHHADDMVAPVEQTVQAGGDDDLSPADLAGQPDVFTEARPMTEPRDNSWIMFALTALAGIVVGGVGASGLIPNWAEFWARREPTWDLGFLLAGVFLFLFSVYYLVSIWNENRKLKADI